MPAMLRSCVLFVLLMICCIDSRADNSGSFLEREIKHAGMTYRYQVFVPHGLDTSKPVPIVLFLHGSGEKGTDNRAQMTQGLPPWLKQHMDFPAIVVIPQAAPDTSWRWSPAIDVALEVLKVSITEFHADPKRVYITGLSDGGYGTWKIAAENPQLFAGVVVVCGGITWKDDKGVEWTAIPDAPKDTNTFAWAAGQLRHTPVWIFHGADDTTVPPEQSRRMYAELKKLGAPVRYTEYPGVGHGSWERAYATEGLWPWYR
jgi:predicted peptidase